MDKNEKRLNECGDTRARHKDFVKSWRTSTSDLSEMALIHRPKVTRAMAPKSIMECVAAHFDTIMRGEARNCMAATRIGTAGSTFTLTRMTTGSAVSGWRERPPGRKSLQLFQSETQFGQALERRGTTDREDPQFDQQ